VKIEIDPTLEVDYDDGAGNTCSFMFKMAGSTLPEQIVSEQEWYRPKIFGLLAPKSKVTLTSYYRHTVVGTPPASITIDIETTGQVTLPTHALRTGWTTNFTVTITEVTSPLLIFTNEQRAFYAPYLNETVVFSDVAGTLSTVPYVDESTLEQDVFIDEVSDLITVRTVNTTGVDVKWNVADMVFALGAASLYDLDFSLGKSVEQGMQFIIGMLRAKQKKFGPIVGMVSEYLRDGQFGDLDLPLEGFLFRVKA